MNKSTRRSKGPMGVEGTSAEFDKVVARALLDTEFRSKVLAADESALKAYSLNDADRAALSRLDANILAEARDVAVIVGMVCAVGTKG